MSFNTQNIVKKISYSFLIFVVILLSLRLAQVTYDSYYFGQRAPYLQSMTTNSVIIKWQTNDKTETKVNYGLSLKSMDQSIIIEGKRTKHEVKISMLAADTQYFYKIPNHYSASNQRWFKTFSNRDSLKTVRLWALGDSGKTGKKQQAVKNAALQWMDENPKDSTNNDVDLWFLLGDIAYKSGSQKQYQKALFDSYPNIIKQNPIWPVYGNHDSRRWAYFDIFSLPEQGESGGVASKTEHYYSLDIANVHILILDSEDSSLAADGEMAEWIKKDLSQSQAKWNIAILHHPPYTDGGHDSDDSGDSNGKLTAVRENIVPILEQFGVDMVLAGHSHGYERSDLMRCHYGASTSYVKDNQLNPTTAAITNVYNKDTGKVNNGTLYVVAGSSAKQDQADYQHPALPHSHAELGSLVIDIKGNELLGHFINDQGLEIDFFKIIKSAQKATNFNCN